MKINFIIPWEIYPFDVMVSIGEQDETVIKKIEKYGYVLSAEEKEKIKMDGTGRTIMLIGGQTIMRFINPHPAIIAHEVFHAVSFLMDRIGIKYQDTTDEAFAYSIEFLTRKIHGRLKSKGQKTT